MNNERVASPFPFSTEQMLEVLSAAEGFRNTSTTGDYLLKPDYRPEIKFERNGLRLGHGVRDLVFEKVS